MNRFDNEYMEDEAEFRDALDREDEQEHTKHEVVMKIKTDNRTRDIDFVDRIQVKFTDFKLLDVRVKVGEDTVLLIDSSYNYGERADYVKYVMSLLSKGLTGKSLNDAIPTTLELILTNFLTFAQSDPTPVGGLKNVGNRTSGMFPKSSIHTVIYNFCDYLNQVDPKVSEKLRDEVTNKIGRKKVLMLYRKLTTSVPINEARLLKTLGAIKLKYGEIINEHSLRTKFKFKEIVAQESECQEFKRISAYGGNVKKSGSSRPKILGDDVKSIPRPLFADKKPEVPQKIKSVVQAAEKTVDGTKKLYKITSTVLCTKNQHVAYFFGLPENAGSAYASRAYTEKLGIDTGSIVVSEAELDNSDNGIVFWAGE